MKNIMIIGVAKSGKSTLAIKLKNEGDYSHIPLDYFTSSLKHNFPETNIKSDVIIDKESSKALGLLLSRVIQIMDYGNENYIIDSAHLYPEDIIKYIDKNKWEIYCVGYPNITATQKLKMIRKYETENDWTYNRSDEELLNILKELISISKTMQTQCKKLNIKFIDTSKNFKYIPCLGSEVL